MFIGNNKEWINYVEFIVLMQFFKDHILMKLNFNISN